MSQQAERPPSSPERIKHLEFLQAVINRLAGNSFLIKGWSVTLVAALFALAAKEAQHWFAIISLLPALCFWGLDAYFLRQERLFRKLFEGAASPESKVSLYSMDTTSYFSSVNSWFPTIWSITLWPFYGPIVIAAFVATILTWREPCVATKSRADVLPKRSAIRLDVPEKLIHLELNAKEIPKNVNH